MKTMCNRCGAAGSVNDGIGVCERCGERVTAAGGERSGIIDVRSLAGLLQQDRQGAPATAPRLGGLSLVPVAPAQPAVAPAPARPAVRASQAPLYGLLGLMTAGMVSLAGYVLSMPAAAGPAVEVRYVEVPVAEEEVEEDEVVERRAERPAREEPAAEEPATPGTPAAKEPAPRKPQKKPVSEPKPAVEKAPVVAQKEPVKQPAKETGPDPGSVECLLKPETCAAKKPKVEPVPADIPAPTAGSSLPEKLELADISEGTRAAKAAAGAGCKAMSSGGEVVKVKLSISGPEGTVLSARPEDDAGNPKLAACVADELMKASFKKVQKPQIGASVTVKF